MIKRYLELSIIVLLMPLIALMFLTISVLILLLDGSPIILVSLEEAIRVLYLQFINLEQ